MFTDRMDIDSPRGTKVVFDNEGGYAEEREEALKVLTVGNVYTVSSTKVHASSSRVCLREFPEHSFNTVQFAPYRKKK